MLQCKMVVKTKANLKHFENMKNYTYIFNIQKIKLRNYAFKKEYVNKHLKMWSLVYIKFKNYFKIEAILKASNLSNAYLE